jgi:hypothetical protein
MPPAGQSAMPVAARALAGGVPGPAASLAAGLGVLALNISHTRWPQRTSRTWARWPARRCTSCRRRARRSADPGGEPSWAADNSRIGRGDPRATALGLVQEHLAVEVLLSTARPGSRRPRW